MLNTKRRAFIKSMAQCSAIAVTSNWGKEFLAKHDMKFGLITNLLEKELQADWKGTLDKVAKIGYKYLEFNHINEVPREQVRDYLKGTGLKALARGEAMAAFKNNGKFERLVDDALFYGKEYLICYWPWMDGGDDKSLDDFKRLSVELNEIGRKCKESGLNFLLHNHHKEFVAVGGGYQWGYDAIMQNTDPALVGMLLDVYWATYAGANVIGLLKKYPGRFRMLHLKDMDTTPKKGITCPGQGVIDFREILTASKNTAVKYFTVEVDSNPNPMECIKESFDFLHAIKV